MFKELERDHNVTKATKNICWTEREDAVDHSIVTRWFKEFRSGCKNQDDQASSSRSESMNTVAVLQAIEANLAISTPESIK